MPRHEFRLQFLNVTAVINDGTCLLNFLTDRRAPIPFTHLNTFKSPQNLSVASKRLLETRHCVIITVYYFRD